MRTKLKIEWPQSGNCQVLASRRLKDEPNAEAGWWVCVMGSELVMGWGRPFSEGHVKWKLSSFQQSEFLFIEESRNILGVGWNFETGEMVGLMGDAPEGNELHLGFDPQQPWAKWEGSVEVVEVIED